MTGIIQPTIDLRNFNISPDGKRFIVVIPDVTPSPTGGPAKPSQINVVLNWFEELKLRVPVR